MELYSYHFFRRQSISGMASAHPIDLTCGMIWDFRRPGRPGSDFCWAWTLENTGTSVLHVVCFICVFPCAWSETGGRGPKSPQQTSGRSGFVRVFRDVDVQRLLGMMDPTDLPTNSPIPSKWGKGSKWGSLCRQIESGREGDTSTLRVKDCVQIHL